MRLLLLGCTGFVGKELVPQLLQSGYQLTLVSRRLPRGYEAERSNGRLYWLQLDPAQPGSWQEPALKDALSQADGVVNLAGEPIAEQRWTPSHLKLLESSRLETTRLLVEAMADLKTPPQMLVNASAIGFYGTSREACFHESSAAGSDFLASLCERWEAAAAAVPSATRLVTFRIGIVIAAGGGALGKMLLPFKMGAGGPMGSGKQWMSWISLDDEIYAIHHLLMETGSKGVYNLTAPNPVRQKGFAKTLGRVLRRPAFAPLPGFVIKILFGEMGVKLTLELTLSLCYLGCRLHFAIHFY